MSHPELSVTRGGSKHAAAAPGKASDKKSHKNKEEDVSYFLGAFIAPPPWKRLYEDEAHEDVALQQSIEPCVWQLQD